MIITRKAARWAHLLKREALGRTYAAQEDRSEQEAEPIATPRVVVTAMLPRPGRVYDNDNTDTAVNTVATDLPTRISSKSVSLALPLPFPYYRRRCCYDYYRNPDHYRRSYPSAETIDTLPSKADRPQHGHEDLTTLVQPRIVGERRAATTVAPSLLSSPAPAIAVAPPSSTPTSSCTTEEQQDASDAEQETGNGASLAIQAAVAAVTVSVDSNRLSRRNVLAARFCA
ncbi:uncharacterized protein LOC116428659 [Nomia melanderi]|uniref:uncharacterized protein LOC116428659 n=1 Tax=Nomia melanderi TaxID=2448451 RepID=UPI0013043BA3|nr:uncharacterized protein LOC116428659 [Nomia melanderi]